MRSKYKVSDIINLRVDKIESICKNTWKSRALHAIRKCRTAALGGHIDKCEHCGKISISYNSCRNRHCPTCQGHKIEQWTQARLSELLPVKYFHLVFTIPALLNPVAFKYPKRVYTILFKSAWKSLSQFADNPKHLGAKAGMISVLHTWGQNLELHPHLHCIVPGGGITASGKWKDSKSKGKYLFNVKSMSKMFRAIFVKMLRKEIPELKKELFDGLFKQNWVVYAKPPVLKPETIVEYLARYTHKAAISNHRILNIDKEKGEVTFSLKDYRKNGVKTRLTLNFDEFIRRFSLHILSKGFTKIRHYGFLSSSWKREKLPALQASFEGFQAQAKEQGKANETTCLLNTCRFCGKGSLILIASFGKRGPPQEYKILFQKQNNKSL